ncbi:hypothetical protein GGR58DRAFT_491930 [Xylaria digitata]|nr:hypothetical protein GGR58DRAFT_491930 [Xylaria digitata]
MVKALIVLILNPLSSKRASLTYIPTPNNTLVLPQWVASNLLLHYSLTMYCTKHRNTLTCTIYIKRSSLLTHESQELNATLIYLSF